MITAFDSRSIFRFMYSHVLALKFVLSAIAFPLGLRTIPEILAGPWPLGFDTVLVYAPFVKDVETEGLGSAFASFFSVNHHAPLVYVLLGLGAVGTSAPPFAITKAAAPLLYGFLGLSLYYFARRGLQWDERKSLFLVIVTTLYFVPLRFSWDMYKNLLGYAFFMMALTHFRRPLVMREARLLLAFAGLTILSSELTAVLLGSVVGILLLVGLVREKRWDVPAVAILGAAGVAVAFYAGVLFPAQPVPSPLATPPPRVQFLYNYVGAAEDVYVYPTLGDVYATVLLLSGIVLGLLVPFGILGFVRERRMAAWTGTLAIGTFSILVWPFAAIPFWSRWLFMLAFPALLFATHGVLKVDRRIRVAFLAVVVVLASTFVALPPQTAFPYYTDSRTIVYLQTSMMQNSVPLDDSPDVVAAIRWLNGMHFNDSVVVAQASFIGWVRLYLQNMEAYGFSDPEEVNGGNFSAYDHVFMIYWAVGEGWFKSSSLPRGMVEIHRSADIAVYELS